MNQSNNSNAYGMQCPRCQDTIPVSIPSLVATKMLCCPGCKLELRLNAEQSREAFQWLNKLQQEEQNVMSTTQFRG